jgi:glycosyltransferase involved in cell wall biosynthesis
MRVLFDAYWWNSGPRANAVVQREIILAWAKKYPDDELAIASHGSEEANIAGVSVFNTRFRPHAIVNLFELKRISRKWNPDFVLTHNFAMSGGKFKTGVYIQDLLFLDNPEWFTVKENIYFRLMPLMAKSADFIFSSAKTTSGSISKSLNRRVCATGLALDSSLRNAVPSKPAGLSFDRDFFLTVGRLNERKNLSRTIEAFLASESAAAGKRLVVVGEKSGKRISSKALQKMIAESSKITFLGSVSSAELSWLYQKASSLLFFSHGEGFGIPLIEAVNFGTPLKISDLPVFREIAGSSAQFADSKDTGEMMCVIDGANIHPPSRNQLIEWEDVVEVIRAEVESAN